MSLTKVSYSMIQGAPVSVVDYGADPTGIADSTSAMAAAFAVVAANPDKYCLIFPSGTYRYTVSPNYGVTGACIYAQGQVILQYEGTGNAVIFDGGASVSLAYDVQFLGDFVINGAATSLNGIYLRSVHHSKIQGHVKGCGTSGAGLKTEFAVCTEFWVKVTNNGSFGANRPVNGYSLGNRDTAEQTSACIFYNPICEGVSAVGILLTAASSCQFFGGTSEGNSDPGSLGIAITSGACKRNAFYGIDCEDNPNDLSDNGTFNTYVDCLFADPIANYGVNNTFVGGQCTTITNSGSMSLHGVSYTNLVNTGNLTRISGYNITGSFFDPDLSANSLSKIVNTPHNTATTIVTLPSTRSHFYNVYANIPSTGNATAYRAIAVLYQDGSNASIISQTNGSNLTVSLSGLNVQVTQTSGAAADVQVVAEAI